MPTELTYPNLKIILGYLEPNLRIFLSNRCPAIRSTGDLVPLKIDSVKIDHYSVTINDTIYSFGIRNSLQTPEDEASLLDLDKFGAVDGARVEQGSDEVLLQIMLNTFNEKELLCGEDQRISEEKERILKLEDGEEREKAWNVLGRRLVMFQVNNTHHFARRLRSEQRIAMIQIPFSQFLHFQITSKKAGVTSSYQECLFYHRKIHEALKYTLIKLLTVNPKIEVKKLQIESKSSILRLPTLLNLKVQHFLFTNHHAYRDDFEAIQKILDPSSFPLQSLYLEAFCTKFENPGIRSAKLLILRNSFGLLNFFPSFKQNVHIQKEGFTDENYPIGLVEKWMVDTPPVGIRQSIEFRKKSEVKTLLEEMKKDHRARIRNPSSNFAIFPISENTEVYVFYEKNQETEGNWNLILTIRNSSVSNVFY